MQTLEQLFYSMPVFISVGEFRLFLHLQPTVGQLIWNAFYGGQLNNEFFIHPVLSAEGNGPSNALLELKSILALSRLSFEPDPFGEMEFDESKIN